MNKIILMGRLTREPEIRYGGSDNMCIASFSIAVDRRFKQKEGQPTADFFNCTAFRKTGEFVEEYLHKGTKILLEGEMQNNNYTNGKGEQVYGYRIIVNQIEFAESKKAAEENASAGTGYTPIASATTAQPQQNDQFMNVPNSIEESLPFN